MYVYVYIYIHDTYIYIHMPRCIYSDDLLTWHHSLIYTPPPPDQDAGCLARVFFIDPPYDSDARS